MDESAAISDAARKIDRKSRFVSAQVLKDNITLTEMGTEVCSGKNFYSSLSISASLFSARMTFELSASHLAAVPDQTSVEVRDTQSQLNETQALALANIASIKKEVTEAS